MGRKMKDSGIYWIGENWEIVKGKYILKQLKKLVMNNDEVITCFRDGQVTLRSNRREDGFTMADKEIGYQGIDVGDLVVHGMDGFAGAIGISDSRGKGSPVLNVLDSTENKKFIMYYLLNMAYGDVFSALATGIRVRSVDIRWNKLANLPYLVPSKEEQNRIVDALENDLNNTEKVIENINQQIQTLEDYKKSVITEAVTKGLDKNVEMKDSGIEWIGEIPKHWKVVAIKYFSENYSGGTPSRNKIEYWEDGKIPWVSSGEINKDYIYDTYEHITELGLINSSAKIFPENTVLVALNGQGKTKGKTAVLKIRATTNQSLTGFICDEINLHYKFLYYQFKGSYKFNRSYYSGGDNRDGIAASNLKTARLSLPNISEQKEIVKYLDEKTKLIDDSIKFKKKQLEVLEEYKKSLIYEYVTGKKEVGDAHCSFR